MATAFRRAFFKQEGCRGAASLRLAARPGDLQEPRLRPGVAETAGLEPTPRSGTSVFKADALPFGHVSMLPVFPGCPPVCSELSNKGESLSFRPGPGPGT